MNVVLLGPPGAGKGTQAKLILKKFNLIHLSSGDLLREDIKAGTPLGTKASGFIKRGALVPDDLVIDLIKENMSKAPKRNAGFLFDGFPRTLPQAKTFKDMLIEKSKRIDHAVNIDVPDDVLLSRISGRRSCVKCGRPYHVLYNPPVLENVCDDCGGELVQRDDDTVATVRQRLETYKRQTEPLLDFYKKEGVLRNVKGEGDINEVFLRIEKELAGK